MKFNIALFQKLLKCSMKPAQYKSRIKSKDLITRKKAVQKFVQKFASFNFKTIS